MFDFYTYIAKQYMDAFLNIYLEVDEAEECTPSNVYLTRRPLPQAPKRARLRLHAFAITPR
jgi:hypothetical protein